MRLSLEQRGDFSNTEKFLLDAMRSDPKATLEGLGRQGVSSLAQMTPRDTGELAAGWDYSVEKIPHGYEMSITNNAHPETDANVAVLLKYGHGTGNGGWVPPNDFISPAVKHILHGGLDSYVKGVVR